MKKTCFYCGMEIGLRHFVERDVGGVLKPFHRGFLKDCWNEYLKFQRNEQTDNSRLLSRVRAARYLH